MNQVRCCFMDGRLMCNDPRCDGVIVEVAGRAEIACYRSDGVPHPVGLPYPPDVPAPSRRPGLLRRLVAFLGLRRRP